MIHCNILKFTRKDIIGSAGMSKMALWEYYLKKKKVENTEWGFSASVLLPFGPHHSLSWGCPVVLGVWQHSRHLPTRQHLHLSIVSRRCQISPGRRAKLPPFENWARGYSLQVSHEGGQELSRVSQHSEKREHPRMRTSSLKRTEGNS